MSSTAVQQPLFDDVVAVPPTEGIKYAGSKLKLLPYIVELVRSTDAHVILDGFSGTTRVSQALSQLGYRIIANDIAVWSKVFGVCYLLNKRPASYYQELIDHLNALPPKFGWFSEHYGGRADGRSSRHADGLKKPWQLHNTMKLDAIREEIDILELDEVERAVALTSLILALDAVDNTLGHYASYLSDWSSRSYNQMRLKVPRLIPQQEEHAVFQKDIFDLLPEIQVDLAYFDPPYGSNNEKMPPSRVRYAAYYHLWTTIILNDRPELFGKAGRRRDSSDKLAASVFEEFRRNPITGRFIAVEAIERLLTSVNARYILLSYSSGGRATAEALYDVIKQAGKLLRVVEVDYRQNVMANMRWTNEWVKDASHPHREFLFLIEKSWTPSSSFSK